MTETDLIDDLSRSDLPRGLRAVMIAGAPVGLIVAFEAVSGGHFNPLIAGLQWLAGERQWVCAAAYVAAQFGGCIAGALVTDAILGVGRGLAASVPTTWTPTESEFVASAALMIIVFGCARSGRSETGPLAACVAAELAGAALALAVIAIAYPLRGGEGGPLPGTANARQGGR
jgi:glycerol uptake facilitator-like aquaporin